VRRQFWPNHTRYWEIKENIGLMITFGNWIVVNQTEKGYEKTYALMKVVFKGPIWKCKRMNKEKLHENNKIYIFFSQTNWH